jgi:hypothetical protein
MSWESEMGFTDSIHRKQKTFPIQDMHNFLPRLSNLVKEAIEEKFGYVH